MTRSRIEPMVRGLFTPSERALMVSLLEKSVILLTPNSIDRILRSERWQHTAWNLANLYLGSIDAELLGDEPLDIVGLSQETTCYVTARYLDGRGKFDNFVVHETAHIFHNWKREYAGLPFTRRKEWLLDIAFVKRETFAYSCEVYARILEQSTSGKQRLALLEEYAQRRFIVERVAARIAPECVSNHFGRPPLPAERRRAPPRRFRWIGREDRAATFEASLDGVEVLPFDTAAGRVAGRINADLERRGRIIRLPDVMIAAIAVRNDMPIATGNVAHFELVRSAGYQLTIENWRNG